MKKGLCEICHPKQWKTISSDMLEPQGYPVYGANGIIGYYSEYNHEKATLLITCRGATCGALNICEPFSYVNGNAMALDNLSSEVDLKYLYYYLLARGLSDTITGSAQPQIVRQSLEKVTIDYPMLEEQCHIAATLDKVSNLIAKRRAQLDKLDLLVKAQFVEMFGQYIGKNEQTLNAICNFIDYRGKTPEKSKSGIPLITAKNVKQNLFCIDPQEFIPTENYDVVMTRGIPQVNDVLFTTEAPLGNVCRIPDIYDKFCVGQRIITMQPHKDTITSEYLEYALISKEFQDKMWQKSSGSTVKGIRSKLLEQLTIPVPPIEQQQQFSEIVFQLEQSKFIISCSLDKLETLKKALMRQYFK